MDSEEGSMTPCAAVTQGIQNVQGFWGVLRRSNSVTTNDLIHYGYKKIEFVAPSLSICIFIYVYLYIYMYIYMCICIYIYCMVIYTVITWKSSNNQNRWFPICCYSSYMFDPSHHCRHRLAWGTRTVALHDAIDGLRHILHDLQGHRCRVVWKVVGNHNLDRDLTNTIGI